MAAAPLASWADPEPAIKTASARDLLTIPVMLDGKGPFRFVVDTGADHSVISDRVANEVGGEAGTGVMIEGVVRTLTASTMQIGVLDVGPVQRRHFEIPVLPFEDLQADGYLGLDVINGYRLSLDFVHNELRLMEPLSRFITGNVPNEVPIPLSGNGGHLRAFNCEIDGIRSVAFIDTGAEIAVGNRALYAALTKRNSGYAMRETIPLTGVTGGTIDGQVTTLKLVKLGALRLTDSRIAIAGLQIFRLWDLEERPALLIGMNWLRRFNRVAIDYGRKELRFDLATIRRQEPLNCAPDKPGCRYLIGSPKTIPRPSVAT